MHGSMNIKRHWHTSDN